MAINSSKAYETPNAEIINCLFNCADILSQLPPDTYFIYGSVGVWITTLGTRIGLNIESQQMDLDIAFDMDKIGIDRVNEVVNEIQIKTHERIIPDIHFWRKEDGYTMIRGVKVPEMLFFTNIVKVGENEVSILCKQGEIIVRALYNRLRQQDMEFISNYLRNISYNEVLDRKLIHFLISTKDVNLPISLIKLIYALTAPNYIKDMVREIRGGKSGTKATATEIKEI